MFFFVYLETAVWFCITINPVPNETGEVVLFLLTLKDITSTKIPPDEEGSRSMGRIARLARTVKKGKGNGNSTGGGTIGGNTNSTGGEGASMGGSTVERFSPKSTKSSLVSKFWVLVSYPIKTVLPVGTLIFMFAV